jgi:hypothetical protein
VQRNVQVFVLDSLPVFVQRAERVGKEHALRQAFAQVFATSFGLVNAHELETLMLKVVGISGRIISGRSTGRRTFAHDACKWWQELDRAVHVCAGRVFDGRVFDGRVFDLRVSAVAVPLSSHFTYTWQHPSLLSPRIRGLLPLPPSPRPFPTPLPSSHPLTPFLLPTPILFPPPPLSAPLAPLLIPPPPPVSPVTPPKAFELVRALERLERIR